MTAKYKGLLKMQWSLIQRLNYTHPDPGMELMRQALMNEAVAKAWELLDKYKKAKQDEQMCKL